MSENQLIKALYTGQHTSMTAPLQTPTQAINDRAQQRLEETLIDRYGYSKDEARRMAEDEIRQRPIKPQVYNMDKGSPVKPSDYQPPSKEDRDQLTARADTIQLSHPDKDYMQCLQEAERELHK